jgi:hypothetical protein
MRNEADLAELARLMGYRDGVELLHHFAQYVRLAEDAGPLLRAQEQLQINEGRRQQVLEHTRPLLAITGASDITPELLDRVAQDARRSLAARQRLADLDRGLGRVEDERRTIEATALALHEKAVALVTSAGIPFDATRGWPWHVAELKRLLEGRVRHAMVMDELIPAARRRLLPESELGQLRRQLEMFVMSGETPESVRPVERIEADVVASRSRLDDVQRRRGDLRVEVEEAWRTHAQRRPNSSRSRTDSVARSSARVCSRMRSSVRTRRSRRSRPTRIASGPTS